MPLLAQCVPDLCVAHYGKKHAVVRLPEKGSKGGYVDRQ
jgi:hypothetical protein